MGSLFIFFNDTATTEIYTLSLHDALPICLAKRGGTRRSSGRVDERAVLVQRPFDGTPSRLVAGEGDHASRSEEHTSELQSRQYLVCRLLLEKKKHASYI